MYSKGSKTGEEVGVIVTDYPSNGDFYTLLQCDALLPERIVRYYLRQLVSALVHVHKQRYVHRAVRPENIMLDVNFRLVLVNFGAALRKGEDL